MSPPDHPTPTPEELAAVQRRRERAEREQAETAVDGAEAQAHVRRAEEAGYLRSKLDDQAAADREG